MEQNRKQQIVEAMKRKLSDKSWSQNTAAKDAHIAPATFSVMLNGEWDNISDEMWNKMAAWASFNPGWNIVHTLPNYARVHNICIQAKRYSVSKCIIGDPGKGKSEAAKGFSDTKPETIYLQCAEYWSKRYFLNMLMDKLDITDGGLSIPEKVEAIVNNIRNRPCPLIIIDEVDKLKDGVLNLFLALYNETQYRCAYLLVGATYFRDRVLKGVRNNKQSYKEIYSRIGGEFIEMRDLKRSDIAAICNANGITNEESINEVHNSCQGDIRKMKNKIEDLIRSSQIKTAA